MFGGHRQTDSTLSKLILTLGCVSPETKTFIWRALVTMVPFGRVLFCSTLIDLGLESSINSPAVGALEVFSNIPYKNRYEKDL